MVFEQREAHGEFCLSKSFRDIFANIDLKIFWKTSEP